MFLGVASRWGRKSTKTTRPCLVISHQESEPPSTPPEMQASVSVHVIQD